MIAANGLPIVIHRGGSTVVPLTVTPPAAYVGSVHLSCGTLPTYATCNFSPATVTMSGDGVAQAVTWTITTSALPGATTHLSASVMLSPSSSGVTGHSLPPVTLVP